MSPYSYSPWFAVTACLLCASWAAFRKLKRPAVLLYYSDDDDTGLAYESHLSLARLVREKVPVLSTAFKPVWWLPEGNTQTIYTSAGDFTHVEPVVYERKLLRVFDGGIIAIDISPPLHSHPIRPNETVVVIAHGLTGGSHEHYVRAAVSVLTAPMSSGGLAARTVVMNFRGCNDSPVTTPKLYHAGSSDDIRPVVLWVTHSFPQSTIFGLGFSLGANIFTKYAGEESSDCPLSGLVSLANPWDFRKGGVYNDSGSLMNRLVYRYVLGGALRSLYHRNRAIFLSYPVSKLSPALLENLFVLKKISLVEFDNMITSPAWGFKDAWDYYTQVSSSRFLDRLRIPVLGINALDDPIMGIVGLPIEEARKNPWLVLAATEGGGHMGWFEKRPDGKLGRWYVKPVKEFFQALLEYNLPARPRPTIVVNDSGLLQQVGRPEVGFAEVLPGSLETFTSGDGESKLFSGW